MRLDEFSGKIGVNPLQAASLIRTLFDPTEIIAISSKRAKRLRGANVFTQPISALDLIKSLEGPDGAGMLYSLCTDPEPMDTYFGLAPIMPDTFRGVNTRVRDGDVAKVGLLYADLDVKPGSFASQQEALGFLQSLPHYPNVIVSSGSGGLHAYWRIAGFDGVSPIGVMMGKDLLVRWWAFLSEAARGRKIDKLVDVTRMSRLPGTIRWPKEGSTEVPNSVELLYASRTPVLSSSTLLGLTRGAWENLQNRRKEVKRNDEELNINMEKVTHNLTSGRWSKLYAVAHVEDWVAANIPWDNILVPCGWEYLREDGDGRREWQRPGGNGKSATTDWPDSPWVMSLLSTSYDTGLTDLHDAEIALTKWRVMLRLNFGDDVQAAVQWVLEQMGQ